MADPPALPSFSFDDVTASSEDVELVNRTDVPLAHPMELAPTSAGPSAPPTKLRAPPPAIEAVAPAPALENLDEMLHHTSEQTVRLLNLEERFREIGKNLEDLREEMHAGFTEMRQLVEQARQAMFRVESQHANSATASPERLTARLDAIEEHGQRFDRRHKLLLGLAAGQALLLAVAVAFIALVRAEVKSEARVLATEVGDKPVAAASSAPAPSPIPPGQPIPTFGSVPAISTPAPPLPTDASADAKKLKGKVKQRKR